MSLSNTKSHFFAGFSILTNRLERRRNCKDEWIVMESWSEDSDYLISLHLLKEHDTHDVSLQNILLQ